MSSILKGRLGIIGFIYKSYRIYYCKRKSHSSPPAHIFKPSFCDSFCIFMMEYHKPGSHFSLAIAWY